MSEISAAAVKSLREQTGLPMMDCKRALQETGGDPTRAVEWLRKQGKKVAEKRAGRSTSSGRIAVYADFAAGAGAMVDLRCESAPVANNEQFIDLANDLAKQLATGPGAAQPDELLRQSSPGGTGQTLARRLEDLLNRIREAFKLERIVRLDGCCAGYAHHNGAVGVLVGLEGGDAALGRDIAMHIAAMRPSVVRRDQIDPAALDKEREILAEAARKEGKPEQIIAKMVEGRLKDFYAERCLLEQPHANREKYGGKTIGELAAAAGMTVLSFVHWELPKE
jgi:elongation factor Ts